MKPLLPEIHVNGRAIAQDLIAKEAQNHHVDAGKPGLAWRHAARALIIRDLLAEEAQRQGIMAQPETNDADQIELAEEAQMRALVESSIDASLYDDAAIDAEYARIGARMRAPSLYAPSHILIEHRPDIGEDDLQASAEKILTEAISKPKSFAQLAEHYSNCPSKANGGFLGQMTAQDLVAEFAEVLPALGAGEIYPELVASRFGYHIIRLNDKVEGRVLPGAVSKEKIRQALEKFAWVDASRRLIDRLIGEAEIVGIEI